MAFAQIFMGIFQSISESKYVGIRSFKTIRGILLSEVMHNSFLIKTHVIIYQSQLIWKFDFQMRKFSNFTRKIYSTFRPYQWNMDLISAPNFSWYPELWNIFFHTRVSISFHCEIYILPNPLECLNTVARFQWIAVYHDIQRYWIPFLDDCGQFWASFFMSGLFYDVAETQNLLLELC